MVFSWCTFWNDILNNTAWIVRISGGVVLGLFWYDLIKYLGKKNE